MKSVGSRIRRLREEKEWSQLELAKKVHINNSVLSRIESGKRPVEDELIIKLASLFNVTTDYILGCSSNKSILARQRVTEKPYISTLSGVRPWYSAVMTPDF